jgi:hypothetical protein
MATLKQFLQTGELGPLRCGMSEVEVKEILGPPPDTSVAKQALILKYGALQLTFVNRPQSELRRLGHIGIYYFAPSAERLPEPVRPEDFTGSCQTSIADFRDYLARIGLTESAVVEGEVSSYLIMPSGVRITFDEHNLYSINFASPRAEQSRKQIAVPVSKEDFERLGVLARKSKKSISVLIAEGIPGILREHD